MRHIQFKSYPVQDGHLAEARRCVGRVIARRKAERMRDLDSAKRHRLTRHTDPRRPRKKDDKVVPLDVGLASTDFWPNAIFSFIAGNMSLTRAHLGSLLTLQQPDSVDDQSYYLHSPGLAVPAVLLSLIIVIFLVPLTIGIGLDIFDLFSEVPCALALCAPFAFVLLRLFSPRALARQHAALSRPRLSLRRSGKLNCAARSIG